MVTASGTVLIIKNRRIEIMINEEKRKALEAALGQIEKQYGKALS